MRNTGFFQQCTDKKEFFLFVLISQYSPQIIKRNPGAVIPVEVLAGSTVAGAIHPVVLILLVSAGSCFISYVTDPFFWLVQRTTGDTITTVVKNYTLLIALAGIGILIVALALEYVVFQ